MMTAIVTGTVSFALLFVLGLVLMALTSERFAALQVTIVREPLKAGVLGLVGVAVAVLAMVVLAVTILGIPAAILLALALPVTMYVGLAASASVLGAALPVEALRGKPVLQLAAGVGVLFVASLVPLLGHLFLVVASLLGLGALVITRFGGMGAVPERLGDGPYRTRAA